MKGIGDPVVAHVHEEHFHIDLQAWNSCGYGCSRPWPQATLLATRGDLNAYSRTNRCETVASALSKVSV